MNISLTLQMPDPGFVSMRGTQEPMEGYAKAHRICQNNSVHFIYSGTICINITLIRVYVCVCMCVSSASLPMVSFFFFLTRKDAKINLFINEEDKEQSQGH